MVTEIRLQVTGCRDHVIFFTKIKIAKMSINDTTVLVLTLVTWEYLHDLSCFCSEKKSHL